MAWSFGASGKDAKEAVAALADNAKRQIAFWKANREIDDKRPNIGGDSVVHSYGRLPQEQLLVPHDEQVAQVEAAVVAARELLKAGVVRGPYHVAISGGYGQDTGERDIVVVSVSQGR